MYEYTASSISLFHKIDFNKILDFVSLWRPVKCFTVAGESEELVKFILKSLFSYVEKK